LKTGGLGGGLGGSDISCGYETTGGLGDGLISGAGGFGIGLFGGCLIGGGLISGAGGFKPGLLGGCLRGTLKSWAPSPFRS